MHTHMSLFEGETNAFYSPDDPLQLSDTGKSFIAGILEHATEISAVTNQWVNSYKRLVHGGEAPTAASWGFANRSALVRVPMYTPRKASSRRVEVRSPDSACNPYLTFAVLLAAGLRGVEKGYVLGPQAEDNVWSLTPEERRAMGYRELPGSLGVALLGRWRAPSWSRKRWGSTYSTSSCATSAPSGRTTAATSRRSS